jgi:hypothetical protein
MQEKINEYQVKTDSVKEGLYKYGMPMNLAEKDIFPICDSEVNGTPRIVAGVITHEGLGIKPMELVNRADGKTYWYPKSYLTAAEVEAVSKHSDVWAKMLTRVEQQAQEKIAVKAAREEAAKKVADAKIEKMAEKMAEKVESASGKTDKVKAIIEKNREGGNVHNLLK